MTREEMIHKLEQCGWRLQAVGAALADCEFANLSHEVEAVTSDLEDIYLELKESGENEI